MKMLMIAAVGVVVALAGCGEEAKKMTEFTIRTGGKLSQPEVEKIKSASDVLFWQCTALKAYLPDVVDNIAQIRDAEGYSEKGDFGWDEFVEFDFTISDKPKSVPADYRAAGHHCLFRVSGSELATQKTVCAHLCQGKEAKVDNTYSLYLGKAERAKTLENFESIKTKALRGDYQAQRNLAYGYSSFPYLGQSLNPMLGCAWRIVIIKSGHERVDATDINAHKVYCDSLSNVERDAAEAQAITLLKKLPN